MLPDVAAIVLAAGRSTRWAAAGGAGPTKLVAASGGEPMVRRVAGAALASRARPVVVVLGHAEDAVRAALAGLDVRFVVNPDPARGLASSLRAGLEAVPADAAGALVLLGDMPRVGAALLDRLIEAFAARLGAEAAAPFVAGARGNPVLLGRALFARAMALDGDRGAGALVDAARLVAVEADAAARFDVDAP
ncbi:MAG: nucleotidyltransferase family protein [Hyphomicrobiales bacterium]|nr:nucleotidyltransferase family protein [Hyphomicrobiales bacterium]